MAGEREAVVGEQGLGGVVVDLGPLQLEEQQRGGDRRRALFDELHERAACRIGRVGAEIESGVVVGPADEVVELGHLRHELGEPVGVERRDLAACVGELGRDPVGLVEERLHARFARLRQQRREIPDDAFGRHVGRRHDVVFLVLKRMAMAPFASRRRGGFAACGAALRPHGTQATDSDQEVEEAGDEIERRHLGERNPARVGGVVACARRRIALRRREEVEDDVVIRRGIGAGVLVPARELADPDREARLLARLRGPPRRRAFRRTRRDRPGGAHLPAPAPLPRCTSRRQPSCTTIAPTATSGCAGYVTRQEAAAACASAARAR